MGGGIWTEGAAKNGQEVSPQSPELTLRPICLTSEKRLSLSRKLEIQFYQLNYKLSGSRHYTFNMLTV